MVWGRGIEILVNLVHANTRQIIYFPGDHGQLGLGGGLEEPLVVAPTTVKHSPWTEELLEDSAVEPDFITQVRISIIVF